MRVQYDQDKPTFLKKTYWIAERMGCILMQLAEDEKSFVAIKILLSTVESTIGIMNSCTRLRPTNFGIRCCLPQERAYH